MLHVARRRAALKKNNERSLRFVMDMVHHNPGEPPFDTMFLDPKTLVGMGYNAQVFKNINCAATFNALGYDLFPRASAQRAWLDEFTMAIESQSRRALSEGLRVYYHIDLFVLPAELVKRCKKDICNSKGRIVLKKRTRELHAVMFDELTERFPQVDGYIVRMGETQLFDAPFHTANSATKYGARGPSKTEQKELVELIGLLRDEVCVKHAKELIVRTGGACTDRFRARPDYYRQVTGKVKPHPKLYFSITHTGNGFFRRVKVNGALGTGKHPQIIEVQCQREYEGKGAYPNYIMDGVLNGFEENRTPIGVRHLAQKPLVCGVCTWSRGGGWFGPYLKNEFWCELNAYVLARWACDPARTEEEIFTEFCAKRLGVKGEDAAQFRTLCLLSARAVLKGRYCEAWDRTLNESDVPAGMWMRDDRLGGLEQLKDVFAYLTSNDLLEQALAEKKESVEIWEQIGELMLQIDFLDMRLHNELSTSIEYGLRLFRVIEAGWRVMAIGYRGEQEKTMDTKALKQAIDAYDAAWKSYREVEHWPGAATLYRGVYFAMPGDPPAPGLDATVESFRGRL